MEAPKTVSFIAACKEFFGFKPGQKLVEFRNEIAALTPADKLEIAAGFRASGINVAE